MYFFNLWVDVIIVEDKKLQFLCELYVLLKS